MCLCLCKYVSVPARLRNSVLKMSTTVNLSLKENTCLYSKSIKLMSVCVFPGLMRLSNFKLALTQYTCCLFTYGNKASLSELWMVFTMAAPFHLVFVEVTVSKQKLQCLKKIWWWQLQLYITIQHTTLLRALTIFNLSPMQKTSYLAYCNKGCKCNMDLLLHNSTKYFCSADTINIWKEDAVYTNSAH